MATWLDVSAPVFNIEFDYDLGVSSLTADFSNLMGADDPSLSVAIPWRDCWAEIMDKVPETGGQVVWLDGEYVVSKTMEITKNRVHVSGQGEGTKFKLKAGIDNHTHCFYASHKTGIKISDLLIDGNKNNQNELGYLHHGVSLYYCEKYELNRLIIENFITTCIYDSHGVNGSIESCVTHNSDDEGIMMSYSSYVSVKNNNIRGNLKRGLYMSNCEHCSVVGNVIDQIGSLHEGLAVWWSNNNVFSSNTINGCGGSGAYISASKYNNFIGNTFNDNAYEGLQLAGYAEIESSHNIISGNICIGNGSNGIYINGSYNNLQNNKCYNNGYYGIYISWVNGVNNLVTNNDLIDNVAGGLMDFGTGTITTAGNRV